MARLTRAARPRSPAATTPVAVSPGEPLTYLEFFVEGSPVPKGRPRVVGRGRNRHTYTPERTLQWEEKVRAAALKAAKDGHFVGPVAVDIRIEHGGVRIILMKDECGRVPMRSDCDNVCKAILDGLQNRKWDRGVIADDRSVVELHFFGRTGGPAPRRRGR